MSSELHQLMLERQERLEEALIKAETSQATSEDWSIIWAECGLKRPINLGEDHGVNSIRYK
jgi:hypothetical protein